MGKGDIAKIMEPRFSWPLFYGCGGASAYTHFSCVSHLVRSHHGDVSGTKSPPYERLACFIVEWLCRGCLLL